MNARLNITVAGLNGDLPDLVSFDAADGDIRQWATEAIRNGSVPGIGTIPDVNFQDFVVDRFPEKDGLPARLMLRPKTPFG
jgi:hypothetical protein